jgi:hypothetical protein
MAFIIPIINQNINQFPYSFNLWPELMFIPFTFRDLNQWLRLWDPVRPIHKSLWDVVEMCRHLNIGVN